MRLLRRYGPLCLLAGGLLLAGPARLFAQDPGPMGGSGSAAPETVLDIVFGGGWINRGFMSVLGLFSLVAVAIIIERLVNLKAGKIMPPEFVEELGRLIQQRPESAAPFRRLCDLHPSPIASILRAGLLRAGRPLPEVEKAMEDAASREAARLRAKVRPLSVLASVAPMVGLLGTVVGMILAFRTVSQLEMDKTEALAEGIYLALVTTVAGLVVAIPTQLFAAWFHGRIDAFMNRIDEQLMETIPCFDRMEPLGLEREPMVGATADQ